MNRAVLVFIAIAYALSITLSLVVGFTGGYRSRFAFGFGVATMFIPAVAVLLLDFSMGEKVRFAWNTFPLKYVPVALFLIPVVMHVVMLPVGAALWGRLPWEEWLTAQADGLYHTPASRGWGVLTTQRLVARMAVGAGIGVIANSALAFFEEIGWRGWMLPRLVERMGVRRAVIASAMIWAFWHTPYALSGIHHLDGIPALTTAAIMPIVIVGAGLIIGWLWVRTESIWIVALAHGAMNNWGQYAFKFMGGSGGPADGLVLAAGGIGLLAAGSLLIMRFGDFSRTSESSHAQRESIR
jgi:membrane protease YdiL (CAAX protease family)